MGRVNDKKGKCLHPGARMSDANRRLTYLLLINLIMVGCVPMSQLPSLNILVFSGIKQKELNISYDQY
jgi:hypothetical protein